MHRMRKGNLVMQGFPKRFPQKALDGIIGGCAEQESLLADSTDGGERFYGRR